MALEFGVSSFLTALQHNIGYIVPMVRGFGTNIHIGKKNNPMMEWISVVKGERELSVIIHDDLKDSKQCIKVVNTANKILSLEICSLIQRQYTSVI